MVSRRGKGSRREYCRAYGKGKVYPGYTDSIDSVYYRILGSGFYPVIRSGLFTVTGFDTVIGSELVTCGLESG